MNYSKQISRSAIAKRVILMWVVFFLAGMGFGFCGGYVLCAHISHRNEVETAKHINEQMDAHTAVFGAYEGIPITHEISLDWGGDELDFEPLACDMPDDQQEFLYYLCFGYDLDFQLVMAMIQHESNFDPSAISRTDDYGLMQINIRNHEWLTDMLGLTDFLDPYENMRCGCFILRNLFEKYQDTDMVLMAYNMGEHGAARLWEEGIYETNYTHSVLTIQEQFYRQMEEGD